MTFGTLGGIGTGCALPIFNVLFGKMLDNLNSSGGSFSDGINQLCILFIYIAAGALITGFIQVYFWSIAGDRQTQKFRMRYVRCILSQEIGWFDTCGASELSSNVGELTGKIQDGIGRKVGDMSQYAAQIIAAFGVSFYLTWQLTLVLMCAIPLIAGAGAFMIAAITDATTKAHEQYAKAGGLATETLGAIRTVTALNMQPTVITRYRMYLFEALRVGTIKGFKVGFGNGAVFCACFLTYALGFWYGGSLVASAKENCTHNCLTGGDVMAAFFSTIMGSFALGQVSCKALAFLFDKYSIRLLHLLLPSLKLV
jgi:ATP-binding cassette subfamily B (MDR/TAP) protein 1